MSFISAINSEDELRSGFQVISADSCVSQLYEYEIRYLSMPMDKYPMGRKMDAT